MTNLDREGISLLLDDIKYVSLPVNESEGRRTSLQPNDILISITAELGKIGLVPTDIGEAYINQHTALVRPKLDSVIPSFLAFKLSSKKANQKLNRLNDAGAKAGLNLGTIRCFSFFLPHLEEQEKIAAFLSSVDDKLNQLRRKRELLETFKRGLMQKIFKQELRFTQDDGTAFPDWEVKKLGDLADRKTAKNTSDSINRVLTNSATQGVLDQRDYFDKDIANENNLEGYYIIEKGDYVYNPRISVNAPVGPINKNKLGLGVMSPLYSVFCFKDNSNDFYEQYFQTSSWHKYMCSVANYGARHDRMNITASDFMAMPLPYPHPDEQKKIVYLLSSLDKKISAESSRLLSIETFKKGLLQKMFV